MLSGAHGGVAWRTGMLITVSGAEALALARAQLREATGSLPFTGESEAEHTLRQIAGTETHAGIPL